MERKTRWQDWVNLVFGIWLFIAPFVLGFAGLTAAAWNSYILGIGVAVFALIALVQPQVWEEWINLVLGIWLIVSPFLLGYAGETVPTTNHIVLGILVGADALWAMRGPQPHPV